MSHHTFARFVLLSALLLCLLLAPAGDAAAARHVGNVVVIEDIAGNILPEEGMCDNILFAQGLCVNHAANAFYMHYGDDYDVLVMFTTKMLNPLFNVAMGFPVQKAADGIGLSGPHAFNPGQFGSAGRLIQCVKMGDLNALPENPKDLTTLPPITAVELMAHEVGHQWLVWTMLDLNDGRGSIPILRGY